MPGHNKRLLRCKWSYVIAHDGGFFGFVSGCKSCDSSRSNKPCPKSLQTLQVQQTTDITVLNRAANCTSGNFLVEWHGTVKLPDTTVPVVQVVRRLQGMEPEVAKAATSRSNKPEDWCLESQTWQVKSTTDIDELITAAAADNCTSFRTFLVEWHGTVNLTGAPIVIGEDTHMTIRGSSADAVLDGASNLDQIRSSYSSATPSGYEEKLRAGLIEVSASKLSKSGSLALENLTLRNGAGDMCGAIYVARKASLNATECSFINNEATGHGGAITCLGTCNIHSSKLIKNSATESGGALMCGGDLSTCSIRHTVFANNTAGTHGGGMQCSSSGSRPRGCTLFNVVMRGNKAGIGGGAIGINNGANTVSISESTLDGNIVAPGTAVAVTVLLLVVAVFCTALECTAVTVAALGRSLCNEPDQTLGIPAEGTLSHSESALEVCMTLCVLCAWCHDPADNGGAWYAESISGSAEACSFDSNVSPEGGAIFLFPSQPQQSFSIHSCSFTDNVATTGAGGAIVQAGSFTRMAAQVTASTFSRNSAQCCFAGGQSAINDTVATCQDVSSGYGVGWPCCYKGTYIGSSSGTANKFACEACDLPELNCTSVGSTIETLQLGAGFWRETITQDEYRQCWNPDACKGGEASEPDLYCAEGYEGPYCAVCGAGRMALAGYRCFTCNGSAVAVGVTVLAVIVVILVFMLWALFAGAVGADTGLGGAQTVGSTAAALRAGNVLLALARQLRQPIIVLQVLTQFVSITGLWLPVPYLQFLRVLDFINLDFSWLFAAGCVIHVDFYDKLLIVTLTPLVVVALLLLPRMCSWAKRTWFGDASRSATLQRIIAKDLNLVLVLAYLVFSSVSLKVFQTFSCDNLEYINKSYLRADYSIECYTPKHTAFRIYAAAMICVYPLGIPAFFAYILRRFMRKVQLQRQHSSGQQQLGTSCSFLLTPYKRRAMYWEVAECIRRLLLTGFLVFIKPGTATQSAVACIFACITAMMYLYIQPHRQMGDQRIYAIGAIIIFTTFALSLTMEINYGSDIGGQDAMGILLIVLNVFMMVLALVQVGLVSHDVVETGALRDSSLYGLRAKNTKQEALDELLQRAPPKD
ncbi:hypothetical protein JKP88DRAFT_261305 [Tribonema minus]|uniref:Uncharacterized protein n=1 Tax=Tribonema minus TaxID=303371 RepID=A0A836CAP8_9STRA|nr:hypothetical protein JKP88DRAFT_261305 [Tribonema minus]